MIFFLGMPYLQDFCETLEGRFHIDIHIYERLRREFLTGGMCGSFSN